METERRWDDYLVAEHELIERSMAVLKASLKKLADGKHAPVQMQRALDFLLEFGDKMHNKKEEEFLFPLMQKKGIPAEGGPIGVMLMEHQAERQLLQRMLAAVAGIAKAPEDEQEKFIEEGESYLSIRAEHIWKENDILYAMGRQLFAPSDNTWLLEQFDRINQATYGLKAEEHFRQMAEEVEKGGGAGKKLIERLSYEQMDAIMEAMPFEVTFVDAEDTVAYFNRLDKTKLFPRTRSVVGRKVDKCHPEKSVATVHKIVAGFKDRTMDKAEFWIDFKNEKILIRYFPVYNDAGDYLGVLEVTQAIGAIQKLTGQKRLLD